MKKIIYKYMIQVVDEEQIIEMPGPAKLLSCQIQGDYVCVWALIPDVPKLSSPKLIQKFDIRVFVTGHENDFEGFKFLDTFQLYGGAFIGHVFYKKIK